MTNHCTTFEQWACVWYGLGGRSGSPLLFDQLRVAYAEEHRVYHTLSHVGACLRLFNEARDLAKRPSEAAIALWFHDAVYDPRATDNEERSVGWACGALGAHEIYPEAIQRVHSMILATRDYGESIAGDGDVLVDIDLRILRSPSQSKTSINPHCDSTWAIVNDSA